MSSESPLHRADGSPDQQTDTPQNGHHQPSNGSTQRYHSVPTLSDDNTDHSTRPPPFREDGLTVTPKARESRFHFADRRGIDMKSPFLMTALLLLGVATACSHHGYYTSLNHDQVGTESQQQWSLR